MPESRAAQLLGQAAFRPRAAPAGRADEAVGDDDLPPHGHDQAEGEVGGRRVEHAGRVRDGDAARRAGGDVDPVVADAEVRHDPQRRQEVERHRLVRDDQPFDVLARCLEPLERRDLDVVELVEGGARIAAGGEDLHPR